jgi:DNA-binding response OmpR family regulator
MSGSTGGVINRGGGTMLLKDNRKRILIADDNKNFLNVMQSILEFAGFNVETAEDGEAALYHIKKLQYDLLVLGVVAPRVDGIRLLQLVRTSEEYAAVPVIFINGSGERGRETQPRELACKAEGYPCRPFKNKAFLKMVKALLDRKHDEAQYN